MNEHFVYDSIIKEDEPLNIQKLLSAATALGCELRLAEHQAYLETKEGFGNLRYVVSVPSKSIFEEFRGKVSRQTGFDDWIPISGEQFTQMFPYEDPSTLQQEIRVSRLWFGSKLDGIQEIGMRNDRLREKLSSSDPLYYAYNWRVPSPLILISIDFEDWFDKILMAFDRLSIGCSLRMDGTELTADGFYIQKLVIRLFSTAELEKFVKRTEGVMHVKDWYPVSATPFEEGIPIYHNTPEYLLLAVRAMSHANGELEKKLGHQASDSEKSD